MQPYGHQRNYTTLTDVTAGGAPTCLSLVIQCANALP